MSHPNPSHDRENEYPSDNYKPVAKKKSMAKKMKFHPHSLVGKLQSLVKESEGLRKYPLNSGSAREMVRTMRSKSKKVPSWFKGHSGHGDLPPGRTDRNNE